MATQVISSNVETKRLSLRRLRINKTQVNVFLDLFLTGAFVVEMEEHFSGLRLHELLGLLFGAMLTLHVILHWDWVVSITRTFFKKLLHESRLNYVLNVLLFADMAFVTVSGIVISRTLGLNLSVAQDAQRTLQMLHIASSDLVLVLVALHVAMHWKWISANGTKYLLGWLPKAGGSGAMRAERTRQQSN